jgi:uncharacterized repeat protein (TIGR03833 family)
MKSHTIRSNLKPGQLVEIVLKKDQKTGILTTGVIKKILSPGAEHHRGIKVMLDDGQVGRVQKILTVIYYYSDTKLQKILTPKELKKFGKVTEVGLYPDAVICKTSRSKEGKFEHWIIVDDLKIKKWAITAHLNTKPGLISSHINYKNSFLKNFGEDKESLLEALPNNIGKELLIYPKEDILPAKVLQLT